VALTYGGDGGADVSSYEEAGRDKRGEFSKRFRFKEVVLEGQKIQESGRKNRSSQ